MKAISFRIDCIPPKSTHQASLRIMKRRDGTQFVGKMESGKGAQVKRDLIALLAEHRPAEPFAGPVELIVYWDYPWRKSEPKRNRALGVKWCDTRPDCDNLAKMLIDCMTRLGFWADDSQVARLSFSKRWANRPGIEVLMSELEEGGTHD
jgi:Holliday junction resolvase RusA-like endonuclease